MEPDVDRSVNTMPIVPVEWLVFVSIVETRAAVFADKMPNAMLLIIFLYVLVKQTTKVIRSPAVDKFQDCVCALFTTTESFNFQLSIIIYRIFVSNVLF